MSNAPAAPPAPPGRRTDALRHAVHRMVAALEAAVPGPDHKGDPGALAALRRSLGKAPGETIEACAVVERFIPELDPPLRDREHEAFYLVAGLFALHPHHGAPDDESRSRSLGRSLRAIRFRPDNTEDPGVERRFMAMLDADWQTLPAHLRSLFQLLDRTEARVDFVQLYADLLDWDRPGGQVKLRWAGDFWRLAPQTQSATDTADQSATSTTTEE